MTGVGRLPLFFTTISKAWFQWLTQCYCLCIIVSDFLGFYICVASIINVHQNSLFVSS